MQRELVELEDKQRELDEVEHRARDLSGQLGAARRAHRRRSAAAALHVIEPERPCGEAWQDMKGDDRVRACGRCNRRVYDLSSLPRDEARRVVMEHEGKVPSHVYARTDGTVTTGSCAAETKGRRRPWLAIALAALAGTGMLAGGFAIGSTWSARDGADHDLPTRQELTAIARGEALRAIAAHAAKAPPVPAVAEPPSAPEPPPPAPDERAEPCERGGLFVMPRSSRRSSWLDVPLFFLWSDQAPDCARHPR